jgi:hypothetical protein
VSFMQAKASAAKCIIFRLYQWTVGLPASGHPLERRLRHSFPCRPAHIASRYAQRTHCNNFSWPLPSAMSLSTTRLSIGCMHLSHSQHIDATLAQVTATDSLNRTSTSVTIVLISRTPYPPSCMSRFLLLETLDLQ